MKYAASLLFSSVILSVGLGFQAQPVLPQIRSCAATRGGSVTPIPKLGSNVLTPLQTSLAMATITPDSSSSETEWTKKRIHNTNWFRSGAMLLAVGLMGASQASPLAKLSAQAAAVLHLFAFSTWFGTNVYTTFVVGIVAFKNLPRQTFGKLQAKLFPKYFALGSICLVLQILTLKSLSLSFLKDRQVAWSLGSALAATLFNQFYMEPTTTKNMLERYDLENSQGGKDTDRYKELKKSFGKMHGLSSLANLIALCGTVAYGLVLAAKLVA